MKKLNCPPYPDKTMMIEALMEVARRAAMESSCKHPEDVAIAMSSAIETAGTTIDVLHKSGKLAT